MSDTLRNYELMLLISSDLSEADAKKEIEKVKNHIAEQKGEVTFEDFWGKRKLAYTIEKQDMGFYHVLVFSAGGELINVLDKELQLNKNVLRHLITITPKDYSPVTSGEVEASEEAYAAQMRSKKAEKPRVKRVVEEKKAAPVLSADEEVDENENEEERQKKLDAILRDDLKI